MGPQTFISVKSEDLKQDSTCIHLSRIFSMTKNSDLSGSWLHERKIKLMLEQTQLKCLVQDLLLSTAEVKGRKRSG